MFPNKDLKKKKQHLLQMRWLSIRTGQYPASIITTFFLQTTQYQPMDIIHTTNHNHSQSQFIFKLSVIIYEGLLYVKPC